MIRHDGRIASINAAPDKGVVAGLLGNDVFSHCAAVVFDVARRTLWLEPPCDRPVPETLAGWQLVKQEDPAWKRAPWVIKGMLAGSAAAAAGLLPGDRILTVGGVSAGLDRAKVQDAIQQAPGTKLMMTALRGAERKQLTTVLRRMLDP